ncbi:FAD-dependent oxidoreductase, partial [Verrucomicrobiota bacterium]
GDGDVAAAAGAPFAVGVGPDDLAARSGTPVGTTQHMGVMFRMANVDMDRCFGYLREHPDRFRVQPFALLGLDEAYESFRKGEMMTINVDVLGHGFQVYNTPIPGVFTFCCPSFEGSGLCAEDLTRCELAMAKEVHKRVLAMKQHVPGFENACLIDCPETGVRETRHIQGDYVLNIEDVLSSRAFPDTIGMGCHPIDIQPIPDSLRKHPLGHHWSFSIPYRCLVPKAVDNLLLAGRCISNTHEASGCTRPTVQCMVTGEAAGAAAALCVRDKVLPRDLNTDTLREQLSDQGVVLAAPDSPARREEKDAHSG